MYIHTDVCCVYSLQTTYAWGTGLLKPRGKPSGSSGDLRCPAHPWVMLLMQYWLILLLNLLPKVHALRDAQPPPHPGQLRGPQTPPLPHQPRSSLHHSWWSSLLPQTAQGRLALLLPHSTDHLHPPCRLASSKYLTTRMHRPRLSVTSSWEPFNRV